MTSPSVSPVHTEAHRWRPWRSRGPAEALYFLSTAPEWDLRWVLVLAPLWTLLAIKIVAFQVVTFWVLLKLLVWTRRTRHPLIFPRAAGGFLLALCLTYLASFLLHLEDVPSGERMAGSLYNLSIWFSGLLILFILANTASRHGFRSLLRFLLVLGVMAGLVAGAGLLLWLVGETEVNWTSPLLSLYSQDIQEQASIQLAAKIGVVHETWFFGPFPRSSSFEIYPTALGMVLLITVLATVCLWQLGELGGLLCVFALGVQLLALVLTTARMAWLSLLVALVHLAWTKRPKALVALAVFLAILAAWLHLSGTLAAGGIFSQMSEAVRPGSLLGRQQIWEATLELWSEEPWLGHGFKPRLSYLLASVGSHSTYLSILFRTGVMGVSFLLLFLAASYASWFRAGRGLKSIEGHTLWGFAGSALLASCVWMITEDLDAPQIASFVFFLCTGYAVAFWRIRRAEPAL